MQLSKDELAVLSELLDEGLDLPDASRGAWVEALSEPFAGAKAILRKMLAYEASGAAPDFLTTLPKFPGPGEATPDPHQTGLKPGARIGVYILIREIGQGGMSTVWLARRTDELVKRPVALKLPHLHLQSARFAERFARERDILANLTHPHIAHLYDAGISAEGQPFLAMEFVAGEPLTQYCTAHHLGVDGRLQLFLQVLEAVDYAHAQSVIHRDLKPSNILVREDGQVVLLDFGIAKLIVDGQSEQTELTLRGGAAFTPHYASPEQIRGDTLGSATDTYSLGVLLYELLSGRPPYELAGSTRRALEEAILSTDPRRPSDVVTQRSESGEAPSEPKTLRNRLRGDLDTIVLKALKKSPTERYLTAGAFAEDLRRYLRHDAVSARPDTLWYRLTKRAHRHQSALQAAAIAGLAVAAIAALIVVQRGLAPGEHSQTTLQSARPSVPTEAGNSKSLAVLPFVDLSEAKNQDYLSDGFSEELLNLLRTLPELRVAARTSAFSFKGKSATISDIGRQLHVTHVLEGSLHKVGERLRVTASLTEVHDGQRLWSQTYDRAAQEIFSLEDDISRDVAGVLAVKAASPKRKQESAHRLEAHELLLQGRYLGRRNTRADRERSIDYYARAVALDPDYALAWAWLSTAYAVQAATGWTSPEAGYGRAREAAQRALQIDPNLADAHAALGYVYLYHDWNWAAAGRELNRALAINPSDVRILNMNGLLATITAQMPQAISLYRRAVAADPLSTGAVDGLGWALEVSGQFAEAETLARQAQALAPQSTGARVARLLLRRGEKTEALSAVQQEGEPALRLVGLALVYDSMGDSTRADQALAECVQKFPDHAYNIAQVYAERGDSDTAFAWLERALAAHESRLLDLKVDPALYSVRADARYGAMLQRMNLPEPETARRP